MKYSIILIFLILINSLTAQLNIKGSLNWNIAPSNNLANSDQLPWFKDAARLKSNPDIPIYITSVDLSGNGNIRAKLIPLEEININTKQINNSLLKEDLSDYRITTSIGKERNKYRAFIEIIPIKYQGGNNISLLKNFEIQIEYTPNTLAASPLPPYTFVSELSSGQIFKISVSKRGIYKIDKSFFENKLKINVAGINPKNIRLLGNGGTRILEKVSDPRIDDLKENRIFFSGEEDGSFDNQDYILFYANGPDLVEYDSLRGEFVYDKNTYSTKSYYFIKLDVKQGLRISKSAIITQTDYTTSSGLDFYQHEVDQINLLDDDECNHGSGQIWYGEELSNSRKLDLSKEIDLKNIIPTIPSKVSCEFASRSAQNSQLYVTINGQRKNISLGSSPFSCVSRYATSNRFYNDFNISGSNPTTLIEFPSIGVNSDGWLDYFRISYTKSLEYVDQPIMIFDPKSISYNASRYNVSCSNNNLVCWNISNPLNIIETPLQKSSNSVSFADANNNKYNQYYLFSLNDKLEVPEFENNVENQNVHSIDNAELVVIYHSSLKVQAERLFKHRSTSSNISGIAIDIDQIDNEFGSGTKDPTAIRDFAKMIYSRNPNFKYLILFGSASYDYRHLASNTKEYNMVPTFETKESLDPILSFPSDDYFGLLDDNEGNNLLGLIDIEIGRILARNIDDATTIVDKIIRYDTDPKILGEWKNNLLFSADDEDGNAHISDMDKIAVQNNQTFPLYNQQKIYLDAYEQITTPGGERYPDVNKAITDEIYKGNFLYTYLGHGGPTGLAQERVLQENDIKNWDNEFKPTAMITATCSFTPYDDPRINSAGQQTQTQKKGTIALFSTVRAVYANENSLLTNETYKRLFEKTNGKYPTLGRAIISAKNELGISSDNSRKYSLFGDPSQKLAYPDLDIEVSSINDNPLSSIDTLRALQKVSIKGIISSGGILKSDFNGIVYVTIFDKPTNLVTRSNNNESPFSFKLQQNIIFKGTSQVINGLWTVEFIVPKDINYVFGQGKISLYASNLVDTDATGYTDKFFIGGFSKDGVEDDQPPIVKLFINNNEFVSGGISNENPKIYAEISDDFGINITGNSIGHDLLGVLDNNIQNPILLNNFFHSKINNYKEGTVEYPLKNLTVGKHTLSLTAWDISNNRGIANIEFNVISSDDVSIEKVYNYPNPFSRKTNFQFETNYIDIPLDVTIRIQSLSGKVVRTIQQKITPSGYRISDIEWDGRDDQGSELANGVYLYQIGLYGSTKEISLSQKSYFQKLVILR
ncbi:MAG: type IX secretion system sortase PorU [Saprospiraceae bacterium]